MSAVKLTKAQARAIILHAAGLAKKGQFGKGREAVYKVIDHLGFVQLDTNYTVERAHHHALAARVPDYKLQWLEELQGDGRIFEFFTSDSGFMPMYNFRFSLPVKQGFLAHRKPLTRPELNLMSRVLDRIAREGPLMVKDFENDRAEASAGWWDWRPSKVALERLYLEGSLMTTRSDDFRKIYDLPKNLVPDDVDTTPPTPEEFARHVIMRELKAMGIAYEKELRWRARWVKGHRIKPELQKMVAQGEVLPVSVEGLKGPLFMLPAYENKKIGLSGDAFILSPFDSVNVFRHRLRDFFGFDYQIECFVPEPKRKYGYFSLPVLIGDTFVARMDSKADRRSGSLLIHNLYFEPAVKLTKPGLVRLAGAIKDFAGFNRCREIIIKKSNNSQYTKAIKVAF